MGKNSRLRMFAARTRLTGKFAALAIWIGTGVAQGSLTNINIYNNISYRQTSTASPTTPFGYFFEMGRSFQNAGDFDSASVTYPGPNTQALAIQGTGFTFQTIYFPNPPSIHGAYPFGTYNFTASNSVTSTSQNGQIDYTADYFASSIPALTPASYTSLQNYTPTSSLDVSFNSFTPNTSVSGGTFFTIYNPDTVATIFTSGGLPASITSFDIPANTLQPNTAYYLELDFTDRLSGTDSVNDVPTLQGSDVRTDIYFTTAVPEPISAGALGAVSCISLLRRQTSRRKS